MRCETYPLHTLGTYQFVVILSVYHGKLMLSRHKNRSTWETQGGHIEGGESPIEAAGRELYEESGAVKYLLSPAFDYRAGDGTLWGNGVVFIAEIDEIGALPESEMAEVAFFHQLPPNLTYPEITPVLLQKAREAERKGIQKIPSQTSEGILRCKPVSRKVDHKSDPAFLQGSQLFHNAIVWNTQSC